MLECCGSNQWPITVLLVRCRSDGSLMSSSESLMLRVEHFIFYWDFPFMALCVSERDKQFLSKKTKRKTKWGRRCTSCNEVQPIHCWRRSTPRCTPSYGMLSARAKAKRMISKLDHVCGQRNDAGSVDGFDCRFPTSFSHALTNSGGAWAKSQEGHCQSLLRGASIRLADQISY